ncbi:fructosamine kinase family protein [Leptolyngbya sp. 7M]|nr:fructosamine kinase family protein [Leptolyngbya sp. 7M]
MWNQIALQISQATGQPFQIGHRRSVGGGSVNQAYVVSEEERAYFVKLNQAKTAKLRSRCSGRNE